MPAKAQPPVRIASGTEAPLARWDFLADVLRD